MDSTLTDTQRRFLETFFAADPISAHFYLSGGTGLAGFYLHHRFSDDIDLFTRDAAQLARARTVLRDSLTACGLEIRSCRESKEILQYELQGDPHPTYPLLKIDVVRDTEPIFAPIEVHGIIRVDALLSIAVNKVTTIFSRGWEVKDYVDLYFILNTRPFDLDALLPLAAQKDLGFDELHLAANLSHVSTLKGLIQYLQHYMVQPLNVDDLIRFCEETAAHIFDRHPPRR